MIHPTVGPLSRRAILGGLAGLITSPARAASGEQHAQRPSSGSEVAFDRLQTQRFRDWFTLLIHAQIDQGPNPRWTHRDCAGLVRFAVAEALRPHDFSWKKANGMLGRRVPADIPPALANPVRHAWKRVDGSRDAFVGALELVQENTRFISRQINQAQAGDLFFYDLTDEQHLMVWMGRYVAYHTGRPASQDNGLRALRPSQLLGWTDTRWRPTPENPNFSGVYRFAFLAP